MRAEGLTTVLNLHDVAVAQRVADRIVGMRDGRVAFDRPTAAVTDADLAALYRGATEPDGRAARVPA